MEADRKAEAARQEKARLEREEQAAIDRQRLQDEADAKARETQRKW